MKKHLLFSFLLFIGLNSYAQIYLAKTAEISFFSETPLENVEAKCTAAKPMLNTNTGDVLVKVPIRSFVFPKPLMQEHFNENYMESDKYTHAIFKGKINEKIDYTKDGSHNVTVTGTLDMHGVVKDRTIEGTLVIKGSEITVTSKFVVHIADHHITVPSAVTQNIAEDIEVKLNATLEPFKKK